MIIRMERVKRLHVSVRQIVTTVFLIQGNLRSDYKSCRSIIEILKCRDKVVTNGTVEED
jgi:hypothetical protein